MNYAMTKQVSRKAKPMAKVFTVTMLVMSILFLLMGIIFDRGMLFLSMLAVLMYWLNSYQTVTDYEYHVEDGILTIDVIKGKQRRKRVHELDLKDMEVVAPNWHDAVAKYRKNGGTEQLKKFDYTSYDDEIPYYTMIIYENKKKIKLLLDLDEEWLQMLKRMHYTKVFVQ